MASKNNTRGAQGQPLERPSTQTHGAQEEQSRAGPIFTSRCGVEDWAVPWSPGSQRKIAHTALAAGALAPLDLQEQA